jgi:hypothetical protein
MDPNRPPSDQDIDDFVVMQRVRDALFSCMVKYEAVHFLALHNDEWFSRQPPPDQDMREELVCTAGGDIVAYKCKLKDGRTVTAELDAKRSIWSVMVDGKPDEVWNKAYKEADSNIYAVQWLW